ncbi:glycosyltransferase family 4 protein [Amphibiibacter pelophylacis]|uniref:Glycosyltransferase family 1 protein n=1 Tax=Amphibiibacter pelophylacis TaxID=1799477 RepID=A0ACC6P1T2_9BURK
MTETKSAVMCDVQPRVVAFLFFSDGKHWYGGKNYFRALFGAMDADHDRRIRPVAFIGSNIDSAGFDFPASVTFVRCSAMNRYSPAWFLDRLCKRYFGRTLFLNRALVREGVDVVSHCDPRESGTLPTIAWIPDFQHVHLPHFFSTSELASRDSQFKTILDRSDLVIVSSFAARDDLAEFSPSHLDKARVLQFCSMRPDLDANGEEDLTSLYGLADQFFYLPNQFWAHKNHRLAVEALARLRERWPQSQIVCSGALSDYRNPAHIEALRYRIAELGLQDAFKLLGLIPYKHIFRLMLQSSAVINPSHFEGWSTTVEEAKAVGVPLLLSNLPVHREQCPAGEALFFSPDDSDDLAMCMDRVLSGNWSSLDLPHVPSALDRHQNRILGFSRTYQAIVAELSPCTSP